MSVQSRKIRDSGPDAKSLVGFWCAKADETNVRCHPPLCKIVTELAYYTHRGQYTSCYSTHSAQLYKK